MEYKGIKLTEVTGSQIVDPPKEMFVWDYDPGCLLRADVLAICQWKRKLLPRDYKNWNLPPLRGDS